MALSAFDDDGMFKGAPIYIFDSAFILRNRMTGAEAVLWLYLKNKPNGIKFRRQHPIGNYIVDFYCHEAKLIIEVDGSIHDLPGVKDQDAVRQRNLENRGLKVIRFTNRDIFKNMKSTLETIISECIRNRSNALSNR